MVRKFRNVSETQPDSQFATAVKDSAQQIWLAGLGAFAKAQQEGQKVFEALVSEGKDIQRRTRAMTEERIGQVAGQVAGRVTQMADGLSRQATGSWDKLEQVFEDRVARALARLGVPTNAEVQRLIEQVETLNASVQALTRRQAGTAAAARKPGAARKPAARKPAARKPAARKAAAAAKAPARARGAAKSPAKAAAKPRTRRAARSAPTTAAPSTVE